MGSLRRHDLRRMVGIQKTLLRESVSIGIARSGRSIVKIRLTVHGAGRHGRIY